MALLKCPDCGGNVSSNAPACPHCGYTVNGSTPQPRQQAEDTNPLTRKRGCVDFVFFWFAGGAILLALALLWLVTR